MAQRHFGTLGVVIAARHASEPALGALPRYGRAFAIGMHFDNAAGHEVPIMPDPESDDSVMSLRNIGPAMAQDMARAGITSATALRAMGADAAYGAMIASGTRPHFIGYYVLHMALQGRPWNDCKGAEKSALRAAFDALKAGLADPLQDSALERLLDEIGTGRRR